jgi:type I restriction enzyme, S subunit
VRRGDLVFTCWGTINQVGLIDDSAAYPEYVISNKQMKLTPDQARASSEFLYFLFSGPVMQREIVTGTIGSSIPGFNLTRLRSLKIYLPPVTEQLAIAEALSDADKTVRALERLIAKKQSIKQGMAEQLLTARTRLQGFRRQWISVKLSDIADRYQRFSFVGGPFGSSLKVSDYTATGVRILQLQNIGDGVFHDEYAIFTSPSKADSLLANNIYSGDLLIAKMGDPVARCCVVPRDQSRYVMASDGIRLAVDKVHFDPYLIKELINFKTFRSQAESASSGSTRKRISLAALRQLTLAVPPDLSEQHSIASMLRNVDDELDALRKRISKAKAIKQGMMHELLTGRRRLPVAEAVA